MHMSYYWDPGNWGDYDAMDTFLRGYAGVAKRPPGSFQKVFNYVRNSQKKSTKENVLIQISSRLKVGRSLKNASLFDILEPLATATRYPVCLILGMNSSVST